MSQPTARSWLRDHAIAVTRWTAIYVLTGRAISVASDDPPRAGADADPLGA
jgi:hypothetical protein